MKTPGKTGFSTDSDDIAGIIRDNRFIQIGRGENLPDIAYHGVIEGLLEPEPKSWKNNKEYPHLWEGLMKHIWKENNIILLKFDITKEDKAFIVDWSHMEKEIYKKSTSTKKSMDLAVSAYWNSRLPALEYNNEHIAPMCVIWNNIEFDRLSLVKKEESQRKFPKISKSFW